LKRVEEIGRGSGRYHPP